MDIISFIVLGVLAGAVSGLVGIGGGLVVVPALVFLFGFSQHQAQGTTLAMMVPPIGLLAAWTYYKAGNADLKVAGFLCIGFFIGGLIGAKTANVIPTGVLKKVFGAFLLIVSLRMIFWK
ncbi:MAG: permease [Deltaproteobacteria bacterium GWC2_56_8]|nr:MAG: permease [Deltaproteobacteria bacterium GWB2_55_19]OGP35676.1 MAG: permease [Deltaproteobacteria bacterium GWC2_56_8]HAO93945.1 permease [Deltaproteobacteria bacterium]